MCENAEDASLLLKDYETVSSPDLSKWMTNLPDHVINTPINQIAIPGSHDSGAFWLDSSSPVGPDESPTIKNLVKVFGNCAKKIVINWSITQKLHITDQLNKGIRYFDMRNAYLASEDDILFIHGVYGHPIVDLLKAINEFLDEHPKEIVLVDFNHFYDFTDSIHDRFVKSVLSVFDGKFFYPSSRSGAKTTVADIWKDKKQVIAQYSDGYVSQKHEEFWHSGSMYSPWADTSSVTKLITFLDKRFDSLKLDCFNVFQAILSPQTSTIAGHLFSSLENCLCKKCDRAIASWLAKVYTSKKHGVNVVICDFMEECAADVIKLNDLLKNEEKETHENLIEGSK